MLQVLVSAISLCQAVLTQAKSSSASHSLPSPLPLTAPASYHLFSFPFMNLYKTVHHSLYFYSHWTWSHWPQSPDKPASNSILHSERDFMFSFESRCMSIHICYFLFQLFLSCYQRFNVDCGNFISLVWHFEDKFLHPGSSWGSMLLSPGWKAGYYLTGSLLGVTFPRAHGVEE